MIDVAKKHKRVVQVGTQQRSGPHYQQAKELIRSGHIGKVVSVRMQSYRNIMPGFGSPPDGPPPAGFDWNMFLGPAPERPYNPNRGLYHFRWFWDYSGGQMTNLGQHSLDIVDWFLGPLAPKSVASFGGRFALGHGGETPDTQDAIFDFPGFTATWSHREAAQGEPAGSGFVFYGTKGSLSISRSGFTITPDRVIRPENAVPQFTEAASPSAASPASRDAGEAKLWTTADHRQKRQFARSVPPPRPQLPRLHQDPPAADLRPRQRPPRLHALPPRQCLPPPRPQPAMGRQSRNDPRRRRSRRPARPALSRPVGCALKASNVSRHTPCAVSHGHHCIYCRSSSSAICSSSTCCPSRCSRPPMFIRQPASVETTQSAPVARMHCILSSTMLPEICG